MSLISIVVPAYNSEKTIGEVVARIKRLEIKGHEVELIVVDDCSKDQTWEKLQAMAGITAIRHPRNTGKGGALRTGFQRARGDFLVIEDDDLEYDPGATCGVVDRPAQAGGRGPRRPVRNGCSPYRRRRRNRKATPSNAKGSPGVPAAV